MTKVAQLRYRVLNMKILILHGPNLNLLGERDKSIYGNETLDFINEKIKEHAQIKDFEVEIYQSNHEGELIDLIQKKRNSTIGMLMNPGGLSHSSIVLHDAILDYGKPCIEIHLSNPLKREEFRHALLTAKACYGLILGFGWRSYIVGLDALINTVSHQKVG